MHHRVRRLDAPARAVATERQRRRLAMDLRARGDRSARKTAGVAERMEIAAARVQHRADVAVRAGHLAQLLAVQILHRHAAADALLRRLLDRGGAGLVVGRAQRAILPRFARDLVAADQVVREIGRAVGERRSCGGRARRRNRPRSDRGRASGLDWSGRHCCPTRPSPAPAPPAPAPRHLAPPDAAPWTAR